MRKLHAYSAAAIGMIAGMPRTDAQIVYTNPEPDWISVDDAVHIDVDGDEITDIWFNVWEGGFFGSIYSIAAAGVDHPYVQLASTILSSGWNVLNRFESGDLVSAENNWINPGYFGGTLGYGAFTFYFSYMSCSDPPFVQTEGPFAGGSSGFIGFRIQEGAEYRYGWVRLQVNTLDPCPEPINDALEIQVENYAIQLTPNTPIAAGDTGVAGCSAPSDILALTTENAIKVQWSAVVGATTYKLRYQALGETGWHTKTIPAPKTAQIIKGLTCNTTYVFQISSMCDGVLSDPSPLQTCVTALCRSGNGESGTGFALFPNPATVFVQVATALPDEQVQVLVYTSSGQLVENQLFTNDSYLDLDISPLPPGLYLLEVVGNFDTERAQFIKE